MNESLIVKITDQAAKKVAYHHHLEIEMLKREIDRLKQQLQPTQAIGFRVSESDKQLETAFKSIRKYSGTHD